MVTNKCHSEPMYTDKHIFGMYMHCTGTLQQFEIVKENNGLRDIFGILSCHLSL